MSAQKRKRMLIGFAGVAIVLIALIAVVSPNFRSEDARGAIGAVQKHREAQITPQDVILGSETAQAQSRVLYADFLADAGALQNVSAQLASRDMAQLNQAESALASAEQQLQQRYFDHLANAVDLANRMLRQADVQAALGNAQVQDLANQLESMESRVRNRAANLQQAEMLAFSESIGQMAESLESRMKAKSFEQLYSDLASAVENKASPNLFNIGEALENRIAYRARLRNYQDYLASAAGSLDSLGSARQLLGVRKAGGDQQEYWSKEAGALDNKISHLASMMVAHATQLEARALANMEALLAFDTEALAAFDRMNTLMQRASFSAENRAQLQSFETQLASFGRDAGALAAFDARDQFRAISAQLQHQADLQNRVRNIDALQNVELASAERFTAHLANIDSALVQNRAQLASAMPDVETLASNVRALMSRSR